MLPQNIFLYSKDLFDRGQPEPALCGYGVANDSIVIGNDGFRSYLLYEGARLNDLREGRFCCLYKDGESYVIRCDATGQEMLFVYEQGGDWAISNSFYLLALFISSTRKLTVYAPALVGFHLKNGFHIGEQLLTHRTAITEISILPINYEIRVDSCNGKMTKHRIQDALSNDKFNYEEILINTIEKGSGLLGAFASLGRPMNIFLSGGYDSRLVLSMLLRGTDNWGNVSVTSHEHKVNDFRVARRLCQVNGLALNAGAPSKLNMRLSSHESFKLFLLSCCGTYLPMYFQNAPRLDRSAAIKLTGDQPTGWDHFYGDGLFLGQPQKIANDIRTFLSDRPFGDEVSKDFLDVFKDLDVDIDEPTAMMSFYSAVRARHHCGRNWYKSLAGTFLVTPLMQKSFMSLDAYNRALGDHPSKLFVDAFAAFGGWALSEPFESPDRAFPSELINNSPMKNGVEIRPKKYKTYGTISADLSEKDVPGVCDVPLCFGVQKEEISSIIGGLYKGMDMSIIKEFFNNDDFEMAREQLATHRNHNMDLRKVTHMLYVDLIHKLVSHS